MSDVIITNRMASALNDVEEKFILVISLVTIKTNLYAQYRLI